MEQDGAAPEKSQSAAPAAPAPRKPGRVVAITGAFGFIGRRLIQHLERDADIERIVAIDVRSALELARREGEPTDAASYLRAHSAISSYPIDLTLASAGRDLSEVFRQERVDTVCHLAFLSNPSHAEEMAHELETIGTMQVLRAVQEAGVARLCSLSSTMLYGARPDNPAWLSEPHELRPSDESRWLRDKLDADLQVRRFAESSPGCRVSLVRLGMVLGGGTRNFWSRYLQRAWVPVVLGYDPLFQILHGDDAGRGLHAIVRKGPAGVFHLVGRGVLPLSRIISGMGRRALPLPTGSLRTLAATLWRAQLFEMPAAFTDYLKWSWLADGKRLHDLLGFTPQYSSSEALARFAGERHKGPSSPQSRP